MTASTEISTVAVVDESCWFIGSESPRPTRGFDWSTLISELKIPLDVIGLHVKLIPYPYCLLQSREDQSSMLVNLYTSLTEADSQRIPEPPHCLSELLPRTSSKRSTEEHSSLRSVSVSRSPKTTAGRQEDLSFHRRSEDCLFDVAVTRTCTCTSTPSVQRMGLPVYFDPLLPRQHHSHRLIE